MHFLLCIYFRKMWSHAVSMGSSLLLDFSFLCSFGKKKKKCIIFVVHSTFFSYWTEQSSVSQVGAEQHVESWGESSDALLGEWKAKLDVFLKTSSYSDLAPNNECLHWGFVFSWSSLLLEVPVSSGGCLLPLAFRWWEVLRSSSSLPCCFLWQMHSPVLPTAHKGLAISLNSWDLTHKVTSPDVNREGLEVCIF